MQYLTISKIMIIINPMNAQSLPHLRRMAMPGAMMPAIALVHGVFRLGR